MHRYDSTSFDPPAPIALVTIHSARLNLTIPDVPMLIDTGADVSLLPRSPLASLITPDAQQYELVAFDGTRSTSPAITAEIRFLNKAFNGEFLLIDNWHGILGRNILNNLSLLFDGPSMRWTEQRRTQ